MEDAIGPLLAIAVTAIAGLGVYVFMEWRKRISARLDTRRRNQRSHLHTSQAPKPEAPVRVKLPSFGRR